MDKRKIGVVIDCFRLGVRAGIEKVVELGLDGFQVYVTKGEMDPDNMSPSKRREFVKFISDYGLDISALCGDMGYGFFDPATKDYMVTRTKQFIDLAVDLGTKIITSHTGLVPEDPNDQRRLMGIEAMKDVLEYAESRDVFFANETGLEPPERLLALLKDLDNPAMKVNYDPANLVMRGYDHIGGVEVLRNYIVHTHAKDGIRREGHDQEVPLGEGSVNFPLYLAALDRIAYSGYLTIERESGEDPVKDIAKAISFLRSL